MNGHMLSPWRVWWATLIVGITAFRLSAMALGQSGSNSPPSIAITNPPSGSIFILGSIIPVEATATDADGTVVEVRFYNRGSLLGLVTEPPYNLFLTNTSFLDNPYFLTAIATDDGGAT